MLYEHHDEHSDGVAILLEYVQLAITVDARIRTPFVTALSVESWRGVLQMVQKHIRGDRS